MLSVGALVAATGALAAPASVATAAPPKFKPVSNFPKYVGGHGKANSKLSPVTVGIVNQQGGQNDIAPQWTIGAQVAADYINNQTGGVDGHPLKLVSCFIPDQVSNATQCGQEFANNKAIAGVAVGPVSIGNQAMESAIAPTKKVLIFGVSTSPVDTTYKTGYIIYGDGTHIEAPLATFTQKYLHAKSVSIVWPNIPGESTGVDIIVDALKYLGVKTVDSVSYDPSATDLTTPIEAAHVGQTDAFIADAPGGPGCSDMYLALKQLNIQTKVLANVPCDSPLVAKADGGTLPIGWYYASAKSLPGDPSDPGLPLMAKIAKQYGEAQWGSDSWWADGFGELLTLAKWDTEVLKSGKAITPAAINTVAKAFHGPVQGGSSTLECGAFKSAPAVCNDLDQFFQNTKPGVFKAIVRWIGPPTGFKLPADLQ